MFEKDSGNPLSKVRNSKMNAFASLYLSSNSYKTSNLVDNGQLSLALSNSEQDM
jgi:hypothetical protein